MKWVLLCLVMGVSGTVLANDYGAGWGGDPWNDSIQPSGLRFGEPTVSVQTGSSDDGPSGGYVGGPGPCYGCNTCTHWATRPWYAHWGPDWIGYKPHNHCAKCRPCMCAPCD